MSDEERDLRVGRLEEGAMFAERRADDMSEQIAALERGLRAALERLRKLEARIEGEQEEVGE